MPAGTRNPLGSATVHRLTLARYFERVNLDDGIDDDSCGDTRRSLAILERRPKEYLGRLARGPMLTVEFSDPLTLTAKTGRYIFPINCQLELYPTILTGDAV